MFELLRRVWKSALLRGVHYGDSHGRLDALYRLHDPWGMEGEAEQFRFGETNRIILENMGHVGTLLEIGCGEGHQSLRLLQVCDSLHGVDVSARAIERARTRCAAATFSVGDLFSMTEREHRTRVDLVVACEVLYYMRDIRSTVSQLSSLGRSCLVTYYQGQAARLDPVIEAISGVRSERFAHGDTVWNAHWWKGVG